MPWSIALIDDALYLFDDVSCLPRRLTVETPEQCATLQIVLDALPPAAVGPGVRAWMTTRPPLASVAPFS
jgi:hypothetical protein